MAAMGAPLLCLWPGREFEVQPSPVAAVPACYFVAYRGGRTRMPKERRYREVPLASTWDEGSTPAVDAGRAFAVAACSSCVGGMSYGILSVWKVCPAARKVRCVAQ